MLLDFFYLNMVLQIFIIYVENGLFYLLLFKYIFVWVKMGRKDDFISISFKVIVIDKDIY